VPSSPTVTVRLRPVAGLVIVICSPALARPATAPVTLCAIANGAIDARHDPNAIHSAALRKILLFIPDLSLAELVGWFPLGYSVLLFIGSIFPSNS
jgi:hypothetical protein